MKLKTCPFCGSEPELNYGHYSFKETGEIVSIAYVICRVCGIRTMNHRAKDDRTAAKMAVHNWNMRTEESDER